MAAEDELALPQVPEARADDVEDVSWSLSTAEAMWARGEHLEGIKWIRKAAEAASDVDNDPRALELAKAASELATIVARRSRASIGDGPSLASGALPELHAQPASAQPASAVPVSALPLSALPPSVSPTTTRSQAPPQVAPISSSPSVPAAWSSRSSPPAERSSPPIPLPSMAAQPTRSSSPPATMSASAPPATAPRPFSAAETKHPPLRGRAVSPPRVIAEQPKPRRLSREELDPDARAASAHVNETAPLRSVGSDAADRVLRAANPLKQTATSTAPVVNGGERRMRSDPEPTVVARLEDLEPHRERSVAEWDSLPTENLTGNEMDHISSGDRQTAFAVPAQAAVAPAPLPLPAARLPQSVVHDPGIQTSQAVRVVVWRDANGVQVAPAGTVVSSITIDAVLVVLEEGADLTAWLSQRER